MRKATRVVGALAVAALALTGCGGGSKSGTKPLEVDSASINQKNRDELGKGGTLNLSITALPTNWNQQSVDGNTADLGRAIALWISPTLWDSDSTGVLTPNKDYLEDYKVEGGKDGQPQKVTLKLNKKAVWNDGSPITYLDFQAIWNMCKDQNTGAKCVSTSGFEQMASVDKGADEFEVVATFKENYPDWQGTLLPYNHNGMKDANTFNTAWAGDQNYHNEWWSGPYMIGEVNKAEGLVTLVPNPKWWGNEPLLNKVVYRVIKGEEATATAFAAHKLDVVDNIISADTYARVSKVEGTEIRAARGASDRQLFLNSKNGPLQSVKVRQAIAMGLDRLAITKLLGKGLPIKAEEMVRGNHILYPGSNGYQDNSPKYDKAAAKKLLESDGYKMGASGYYEKDGKVLTIEFINLDLYASKNESQAIQNNLKDIGIDVKLNTVSSDDFFDKYVIPGNFAMTSFGWVGSPLWPFGGTQQIYGCGSESNYSYICDKSVDELIAKLDTTLDRPERNKLANEIDKKLWEQVYSVPLYARYDIKAVPKDLANYGASYLTSVRMEDVGFVKGSSRLK